MVIVVILGGYRKLIVTQVMRVRLKAKKGGLAVEPLGRKETAYCKGVVRVVHDLRCVLNC